MGRFLVIGGGISGLSAAYYLAKKFDPTEITLIEATPELGGVIRGTTFGERWVETGPDSFITRNSAAVDLAGELGLTCDLTSPATNSAYIYSNSRLHPMPKGTVFGAPSDLNKFLGNSLISKYGQARAALELILLSPKLYGDTTVGRFAKRRWGKEVTEKLIDPLVGGIHAGSAFELSLELCAPQYLNASKSKGSVSRALRDQARSALSQSMGGPAFYSFGNGLSQLVESLSIQLRNAGVQIITSSNSSEIVRNPDGFTVKTSGGNIHAEAVICATPAYVTSNLVAQLSKKASELLGVIDYASPIMTLISYPDDCLDRPLEGSGVLVPKTNRTLITAVTFGSNKWPLWKSEGETFLRVSSGRFGDNRAMEHSDESLVANLESELSKIIGTKGSSIRAKSYRWQRSLPQYRPYHKDLIERIRENLPEGIELAGAPFVGVGIPACITSGKLSAERLSARFASHC